MTNTINQQSSSQYNNHNYNDNNNPHHSNNSSVMPMTTDYNDHLDQHNKYDTINVDNISDPQSHYKVHHDTHTHSIHFWFEYTILSLVVLIAEASRGLVIPTLSSYIDELGGGEMIVSLAVSIYSIGRFIATLIFGYYDYISTRTLLQISLIVCIIGNLFYVSADYMNNKTYALYILLFSRALTGCGTAVMSVARSHVAQTTSLHERTRFVGYLGIVQFIGFTFSPALGGLGENVYILGFHITNHTISTWLLAFIDIILCISVELVMTKVMKSPNRIPSHIKLNELNVHNNNENNIVLSKPSVDRQQSVSFFNQQSLVPWIYVILNLTGRGILSISETYAALLYYQVVNDNSYQSQQQAGYYFTGFGCIGVLFNFAVPYMEHYINDLLLLKISLLTGSIGFILLCSLDGVVSFTQYIIGMILIWGISCPLNQTLTISMLSKHLGTNKQGRWMSAVTASGSLGRILCPPIAGLLINDIAFGSYQQNAAYIFAALLAIISFILCKLYLHKETEERNNDSDDVIEQNEPFLHTTRAIQNDYKTYDNVK